MTTLLELPPDRIHRKMPTRTEKIARKLPPWAWVAVTAVLALLVASAAVYLTVSSTTDRGRANVAVATGSSLSDTISQACDSGSIPDRYKAACSEATSAQETLTQVQATAGATGATGAAGETGAAGVTGTAGLPGLPGGTGETGAAGPSGAPGVPGAAGAQGDAGPAGAAGEPGTAGAAGSSGTEGAKGDKGDPCLSTDPACVGPTGASGTDGQPPLGWTTNRGDGTTETCTRAVDFDPAIPQYVCTVGTP